MLETSEVSPSRLADSSSPSRSLARSFSRCAREYDATRPSIAFSLVLTVQRRRRELARTDRKSVV